MTTHAIKLWEYVQLSEQSGFKHLAEAYRKMLVQELLNSNVNEFFQTVLSLPHPVKVENICVDEVEIFSCATKEQAVVYGRKEFIERFGACLLCTRFKCYPVEENPFLSPDYIEGLEHKDSEHNYSIRCEYCGTDLRLNGCFCHHVAP